MRIGIEAQRIFRRKKHGMDIYAIQLIKHLQKIDKQNEYFIFVKPGEDICLNESENFKIIEIKALTYLDWEQVWLPIKSRQFKLDVLHCTSNTAPLFAGVRTIITLHDIIYLNKSFSGGSIYQRLGHYYRRWVVPQVVKKASKLLTVSNYEAQRIQDHFMNLNNLKVIYNGVNPAFFTRQQANNPLVNQLPSDYLLFLGNTAPKKNMKRLLAAYQKYREQVKQPMPLVIAESSPALIQQMLKDTNQTNALQDIICIGYVSNDLLPEIFRKAKLFLYPSLAESFGIPIIEAMASGTPVITSNTTSMPEVAQGAAELINPFDTTSIVKAIMQLLQDNQKLTELIEKGEYRAKKFLWIKVATKVLETYKQPVSNNTLPKVDRKPPTIERLAS